jgi:Na+-transporting methylmalonyl-CoA/oxaloacetate decarboxylase gamma subunit
MEAFNIQNIVQGNGVAISLTGMAIVFSGLIIMSVFISLLPSILNLFDRKTSDEADASPSVEAPVAAAKIADAPSVAGVADDEEDKDIASLIGLILHLENERHYESDNQYITINRDGTRQSMWGRTGNMRSTPHRRNYAKV